MLRLRIELLDYVGPPSEKHPGLKVEMDLGGVACFGREVLHYGVSLGISEPGRGVIRRTSQSATELDWVLRIGAVFSVACGPPHDGYFNRSGLLPAPMADAQLSHQQSQERAV